MNKTKLCLRSRLAYVCGRLIYKALRVAKKQASTLPGYVMQRLSPKILSELAEGRRIVAVTGTNGKTTTSMFICEIFKALGEDCLINGSGANLSSGLITCLMNSRPGQRVILEVDEAAFAKAAADLRAELVLVTNLFRDQLDRYGELDAVYRLILTGLRAHPASKLLICADDPNLQRLAEEAGLPEDAIYSFGKAFAEDSSGADDKRDRAARAEAAGVMAEMDAAICPRCLVSLQYRERSIAQLGLFSCPRCSFARREPDYIFDFSGGRAFSLRRTEKLLARPDYRGGRGKAASCRCQAPLQGLYNAYNMSAAAAVLDLLTEADLNTVLEACGASRPRFGRQERLRAAGEKEICFLLVKNPAGYAQALEVLRDADDLGGIVFLLNDNPADGCDVSWIWDVPFETVSRPETPFLGVAGTRAGDLALRLSYWGLDIREDHVADEKDAAALCLRLLEHLPEHKTLYILPNYTAMLRLRGELTQALGYSDAWVEG